MYSKYPRRSIPQVIHEWAHDIIGEENRVLPIIKELLEHIEAVTNLWKNNEAYQDLDYERIRSIEDCRAFGSLDKFEKYMASSEYQEKMDMLMAKGTSYAEARKKLIRYFAILSGLEIHEEKAFQAFYQELNNLTRINGNIDSLKRKIILEHYEMVYHKCMLINLIRRKNAAYSRIIGQDIYVESILGPNGINLKNNNPVAYDYVFGLENEETELDNRKMVIEFNQMGRK